MQRAINRALSGNKEALDLLDIADEQVIPSIRTITPQTLQADYKYACRQYLAAMQLQLRGMERLAKKYILTLFWINQHQFKGKALPEELFHVRYQDILDEMSIMAADLPLTRPSRYVSDSDEAEHEDQTMQSGKEQSDPRPEVEEGMKTPLSTSARKRELTPSTSKPSSTTPRSSEPSKRSHHKKQRCKVPGCKFDGFNLKRHMQVHVKKGEVSQENVTKLSTIMSSSRQRGHTMQKSKGGKQKRGHFRKWCPVPDCDKIVLNVGRHLSSSKGHNIAKGSARYLRLLKVARRYTGTAEMQVYLEKPTSEESGKEEETESQSEEEEESDDPAQSIKKARLDLDILSDHGDPRDDDANPEEEDVKSREKDDHENSKEDSSEDSDQSEEEEKSEQSDESEEEEESEESEESEEEEADTMTADKYFTATVFDNYRHQWLVGF